MQYHNPRKRTVAAYKLTGRNRMKMFGYRIAANGRRQYVAQLPGDGGVDWGYTQFTRGTLDMPLALSPYWQARFQMDCLRVGTVAHFCSTATYQPVHN
jgi:hypothetical protein